MSKSKSRNDSASREAKRDRFTGEKKSSGASPLVLIAGLVVVVIIIGILAAIVAPNVIGRVDDAQITKAKAEISNIENALKFYRLDNFQYPTTEQGLEALVAKPADPSITNWKPGGYLDRVPKDPWGNPYQYLNPGNNGEIDIYTLGRDGRPGGEGIDADIGNWNLE